MSGVKDLKSTEQVLMGEKCAEMTYFQGKLLFYCIHCPKLNFIDFEKLKDHLYSKHFKESIKIEQPPDSPTVLSSPAAEQALSDPHNESYYGVKVKTEEIGSLLKISSDENLITFPSISIKNINSNKIRKIGKTKKLDPDKPKRVGNWNRIYKTTEIDGATRYQCEYENCNKHFNTRDNLRTHERIHKNNWKDHPCEQCGRNFRTSTLLKNHLRVHTGERPYKCDLCEKDFRTSTAFITHKKKHIGIKKFECQYCGMKFYVKEVKNAHERTHTGEKPYVCDICGAKYISSTSLNNHRITHFKDEMPKAFGCTICSAKFYRQKILKAHVNEVHSTEKKFTCDVCDSAYKTKFQLTQHTKIHLGINEYRCNVCEIRQDSSALTKAKLPFGIKGQEFVKYSRVRDHIRLRHKLKIKTNYTYTPAIK